MDKRTETNTSGPWRLRWVTAPLLRLFKRVSPRMSQTEREALDAGSVWWDGDLFSGKPRWAQLRKLQLPPLSSEEQAFIEGPVEQLCAMLDDWEITHERKDLPPEVWEFIKANGFFSMIIPRQYGGLAFSAVAHSEVVMKIATRSVTAAVTVMVPNSLGPGKLLLEYGTPEQKDYYLPRLARGEEIPCFALTNPEAGSDAGAIPDNGVVCHGDFGERKNILGIRLNWNKRYITLGPVATLLGLAFKLYDPDGLLGNEKALGTTLALIPTDTPGVHIGRRHLPLNVPFMNGPNEGKDVFIPMDYIIGGQQRAGQGWRMLMECLSDGRGISLPALSVGSGKLASRAVGAYARVRRQFNLPIGRFEGVQEALARIGAYTYMMDAARLLTVGGLDLGEKPSVISAVVKYHLTEGMRQVVNDAMDVLGGAGICLGRRNLMGRVYQAVPISITVEGANILTRNMIIFGQGAIRSHPFIFQELEAVNEAQWDISLRKFDRAFFGHMRFFFTNLARTLFHALTAGRFGYTAGGGAVRPYYKSLTRMSAAFALLTDVAVMVLGASLKRKERLSARLGDIFSHLYLASAVLKHYEEQGAHREDTPLMRWAAEFCLFRIQQSAYELFANFPNRPVAWCLRLLIFPWGRPFKAPSDARGAQVADLLMAPSDSRDRLTRGMFYSNDASDTLVQLEDALTKVARAEPIERRLRTQVDGYKPGYQNLEPMLERAKSQMVLTDEEIETLRQAETARWQVIQVDDFDKDLN